MIRTASRVAIARSNQLAAKSSTYSTRVGMKDVVGDTIQKSKMGNVRGCVNPNNPIVAINELKNESIKAFAEFEFKPASKLMHDCIVNT